MRGASMDLPVTVDLEIESEPQLVRLVRLVASGVASVCGFDIESTEDCRIAVDELCASLIEVSDGSPLEIQFRAGEGGLHGSGRVRRGDGEADAERLAVSRRILAAVCDEFELVLEGPVAYFSFSRSSEEIR